MNFNWNFFWKPFWIFFIYVGFVMIYKAFVNPIEEFALGALLMGIAWILIGLWNLRKIKHEELKAKGILVKPYAIKALKKIQKDFNLLNSNLSENNLDQIYLDIFNNGLDEINTYQFLLGEDKKSKLKELKREMIKAQEDLPQEKIVNFDNAELDHNLLKSNIKSHLQKINKTIVELVS